MPEKPKTRLAGPSRPTGAPEIPQFHLRAAGPAAGSVYAPRLYGAAHIVFADKKRGIHETRGVSVLLPIDPAARTLDWDVVREISARPAELSTEAAVNAPYLPLSDAAMEVKAFTRWARQFDRWLARTQRVVITPKTDTTDAVELAPKRGGVTVELVAIVWELISP